LFVWRPFYETFICVPSPAGMALTIAGGGLTNRPLGNVIGGPRLESQYRQPLVEKMA